MVMTALLVLVSLCAAFIGFMTMTPATTGVYFIALACFFGILARVAQANYQHDERIGRSAQPAVFTPGAAPEPSPAEIASTKKLDRIVISIFLAVVAIVALYAAAEQVGMVRPTGRNPAYDAFETPP